MIIGGMCVPVGCQKVSDSHTHARVTIAQKIVSQSATQSDILDKSL